MRLICIWVPWKFLRLPDYAYGYFLWMCIQNLKCAALAIPEILAIGVLVGVVNPNLGEEVAGDRGWYHLKERWWLPIGPPYSNFSSILTRFRDIATFVLQHVSFSHPTSSLPKISPCFPGSRWMILGYGKRRYWANFRAVSFQDFQPTWSWSTNVTHRWTDRQTNRRHAIARPHFAVQCIAR